MNMNYIAASGATVAPFNYRPDTIDAGALLRRIEAHLIARDTSATVFGRKAINDPSFVFDLRKGRRVTRRTASRIETYLTGEV